jgi:hypothetical protein
MASADQPPPGVEPSAYAELLHTPAVVSAPSTEHAPAAAVTDVGLLAAYVTCSVQLEYVSVE